MPIRTMRGMSSHRAAQEMVAMVRSGDAVELLLRALDTA